MLREIDNHTERTLMNGVVFAMAQIASSTHRKHLGLKGRYSLIITLFMGLGLLVIAGTVLSRILHLGDDQVYTLLNTHMQMVASQIDGTFYEAAGLAQQMSPEGTVGKNTTNTSPPKPTLTALPGHIRCRTTCPTSCSATARRRWWAILARRVHPAGA
ncbi:MAG: hypothetical protein PUC00_06820 [Clostridiales bacterium]|nr:hypothetical protein [Clostridiales bacterium]